MSEKPPLTGKWWLLPVGIAVAALVVLATLFWPGGGDSEVSTPDDDNPAETLDDDDSAPVDVVDPGEEEQPDLSFVEQRNPDDPLSIGDAEAPVVLVVFSDYQCPYCASWSEETLPVMMDYVDAGDLFIEWRDLNVFGPASERASQAAYAAGLQGGFWDYHEALFAGGEIRSENELSDEALIGLADDLGLSVDQFAQDLDSAEVIEAVETNQQLGMDLGAYSTPAFVLGGEPMVGAQPTEVFTEAVDQALEQAQE
ncbi:DsbA family protein [Nesterenkonia sp.]|uniref:DsbA family protein n=1 Tax=Nesterenkonia sp. TaxID=704201 RepID=UPI00261725C2|nr:DsbA family protein [Nesterenkonia sp.]